MIMQNVARGLATENSSQIASLTQYTEVAAVNNIFDLDMQNKLSSNFYVEPEDTNDKYITFSNVPDNPDETLSITVMLKFTNDAEIIFPALSVEWQNDEEPVFVVGKTYLLLFQKFNNMSTWMGSVVGLWNTRQLSFSDNFDRENANTLGDDWTVSGGTFGIDSSRAKALTVTDSYSIAYKDTGDANGVISVKFYGAASAQNRIAFRVKDKDNCLAVGWSSEGTLIMRKYEGGSGETILYASTVIAEGDEVSVKFQSSSIKMYVNGKFVKSATSTFNLNETKHGLMAFAANAMFDDFSVEGY